MATQDRMTGKDPLTGVVVEEREELTLIELCRVSRLTAQQVLELVEQGIIEPSDPGRSHWRFRGDCVRRVRRAGRLKRDLGVNTAGVALALDLLDEIERLRVRVRRLESGF